MWTLIEGHPDYAVSCFGEVVRVTGGRGTWAGRCLTPSPYRNGYMSVALGLAGKKLLHRLVASAFIPNPLNLPEVNHKHGVKADCAADNLEWTTHAGNQQHAVATGLRLKWGTGVSFYKKYGKWRAMGYRKGKQTFLGYHATQQLAVSAVTKFYQEKTR